MNTPSIRLTFFWSFLLVALLWVGVSPSAQTPSDVGTPDDPFVFILESNLETEAESLFLGELGLESAFEFAPIDFACRVLSSGPENWGFVRLRLMSCRGPPR